MRKKYYRFFGGLLDRQVKWLNEMADQGFRLVKTGKLLYEFETCEPGQYRYAIEFVAPKSPEAVRDYHDFLEDLGYTVFYKNMNLNYSIGKLRWRPWADQGGRLATNSSTFNKELLIVEKVNDGKPFELHSSNEDKVSYYQNLCKPYINFCSVFIIVAVILRSWLFVGFALLAVLPILLYQLQIRKLKREADIKEV